MAESDDGWIPYKGQRFNSFEESDKFLKNWATKTGQEISRKDSKTIIAASYVKAISPALVYVYVLYRCHYSGTYLPKGTGQRGHCSKKCNCPVFIKLKQTHGRWLEIDELHLAHNDHPKYLEDKLRRGLKLMSEEEKRLKCTDVSSKLATTLIKMPLDFCESELPKIQKLIKSLQRGHTVSIDEGELFSFEARCSANFAPDKDNIHIDENSEDDNYDYGLEKEKATFDISIDLENQDLAESKLDTRSCDSFSDKIENGDGYSLLSDSNMLIIAEQTETNLLQPTELNPSIEVGSKVDKVKDYTAPAAQDKEDVARPSQHGTDEIDDASLILVAEEMEKIELDLPEATTKTESPTSNLLHPDKFPSSGETCHTSETSVSNTLFSSANELLLYQAQETAEEKQKKSLEKDVIELSDSSDIDLSDIIISKAKPKGRKKNTKKLTAIGTRRKTCNVLKKKPVAQPMNNSHKGDIERPATVENGDVRKSERPKKKNPKYNSQEDQRGLKPFQERSQREQNQRILEWLLVPSDVIDEILKTDREVNYQDLIIGGRDAWTNAAEVVIEPPVNIGTLKEICSSEAFKAVKDIITSRTKAVMSEDNWTCGTCRHRLGNKSPKSIKCSGCLYWHEFPCVQLKQRPTVTHWFCPSCLSL